MDTPTQPTDHKPALAALAVAWKAYLDRCAELEAAQRAYSKADNLFAPGSREVRDAEHKASVASAGVTAARETLCAAAGNLLTTARALANEANGLWKTGETEARTRWEKNAVGARLYDPQLRERDFLASPWRQALPHQHRHEEYPARLADLADIGPEFAARVANTAARVAQLRAGVSALRSIKS